MNIGSLRDFFLKLLLVAGFCQTAPLTERSGALTDLMSHAVFLRVTCQSGEPCGVCPVKTMFYKP